MQETPLQHDSERDYVDGYTRIIEFSERARRQGWRLSDRQIVHEILHRERAALLRQKSTLPILGQEIRSPAWNHGQADALRDLLRRRKTQ